MADGEPTVTHEEKRSPVGSSHQDLQQWLAKSSDENQKSSSGRRGLAGSLFEAIFRLLSSLQETAKQSENVTQGDKRLCQNEIERLFLWGDGFGARDGSLDDILDKYTELRINVLSLLCELGKLVSQNIFKAIDPSKPAIREECADLRMLLETAEAVLNEEGHHRRNSVAFSDSDTSDGGFAEGIEDIASYTDCLMDLAPALEHPAIDVELKEEVSKIETFKVTSTMAANYCRKIRDKFPHLDITIVERLGQANQERSQCLQESHIEAEIAAMKDVDNPDDVCEPLFSRSGGEHTETSKSAYISESIFSTDRRIGVSKEEYDDTASQTTFATFSTAFSTVKQGIPRVPSLPDSARSGKPFKCLACGKTLRSVRNRRVWKKHIFNDLQPYVCTNTPHIDENCFETFSSRSAWTKHEMTHFGSENQHIKCSFCPPTKAARPESTYFKHLSRHLREVSLAVLSQSHDSDSESEAGSTSSKQAMSDISSLRGSELEVRPVSRTCSHSSRDNSILGQVLEAQALTEPEIPDADLTTEMVKLVCESEIPPIPETRPANEAEDERSKANDPKEVAAEQGEIKRPKIQPCQYKTGKILGAGSYSVVKECVHIDTGRYYAAKVINKRLMAGREHLVRNEIAVLKMVSMGHQNLLTLVDYFETVGNLYLVTDLALGGELFDRICRKGSYYERDTADLIRAVVSAVAYLHDHGIVHRDLKPENLLFRTPEDNADLLIADFGLSRVIENEILDIDYMDEGMPMLTYMAPERLKKQLNEKPVDMWSIGVITYFLLCGYTPFDRDSHLEERQAILSAAYSFTPVEYWKSVSVNARDFIKRCLVVDPKFRITAHEALSHPFLQQADEENPLQPAPQLDSKKPMAIAARRVWRVAITVVVACHRLRRGTRTTASISSIT